MMEDSHLKQRTGNYVKANVLSQGTIDQLYLALRISSVNELTKENMMVILDETFAYFDNNRLKNVLRFLSENYKSKQIIIFSCTEREIEALESIGANYNMVNLK